MQEVQILERNGGGNIQEWKEGRLISLMKEMCDIGNDDERMNEFWKVVRHGELTRSCLREREV